MDVTVITPSVPGRERLLARACGSVWAQTCPPAAHLIRVSPPRAGLGPVHIAAQRNRLLAAVATPWVATLDDDDEWLPHHLEVAARHEDADVVYSWPDPPWATVRVDCAGWPRLTLRARIREANFVPSAAVIRTSTLAEVGGWQTDGYDGDRFRTGATWEDWDLWIRLADAGATFACTGEVTWVYELEGGHEHSQVGRGRG